ncbi:MAG: hypothetical protein J1E63_02555, partial [Muribaculaceae bacterium]|nr:hypothetical protein [Muribaculaceae bacterium]
TLDPMIKSHLLYQLSYGVFFWFCGAKLRRFFDLCKLFGIFFEEKCFFLEKCMNRREILSNFTD